MPQRTSPLPEANGLQLLVLLPFPDARGRVKHPLQALPAPFGDQPEDLKPCHGVRVVDPLVPVLYPLGHPSLPVFC
eukprot:2079166-Lingulodinium_polyedra.AAC.1